jgi:chromate transporter
MSAAPSLSAIFRMSLYYGLAGFGGGYSVLAQLRRDLVDRRRWLSSEDFLVLAELSKSLPGTPATSLLALLGQRVGGVRGGVLAASVFLLPSTALMIACGSAYTLMRSAPWLSIFFDGMNAAMVGVVGAVTVELGRSALRSKSDVAVACLCIVLLATRVVAEPVLAATAAVVGAVRGGLTAPSRSPQPALACAEESPKSERLHAFFLLLAIPVAWAGALGLMAALVRVFVPIGVMTFGGGLAMIPAIEHTVVVEQHWLGPKGFADAIALGQITPGPVAICATFIGYRVAGVTGALVATVAMFAPATCIALAAGHSVHLFRRSAIVQGALRMLAPAVIGMLGAATIGLGRAAMGVPVDVAIAAVALAILLFRPVSPLWMLVGGGLVRLGVMWLGRG